jgi:hypothetical protein
VFIDRMQLQWFTKSPPPAFLAEVQGSVLSIERLACWMFQVTAECD